MRKVFLTVAAFAFVLNAGAQQKPGAPAAPPTATPTQPAPKTTGPKPYKEVITDKAVSTTGLFTVHKVDDKYYFEIPDSMLNREMMAVTRFSRVAGGGGVYGGELANQQTLMFETGPSKNVFLRVVTTISMADSTNDIYKAVTNSNLNPIAAAFDIKAYAPNNKGVVIDVTDFFKSDNQVVSVNPFSKRRFNLSTLAADRSYIENINAYPINLEIKTVKTYNSQPPLTPSSAPSPFPTTTLPAAFAAGAVTVELNTSLILLPAVPMERRYFDPRVGYFADRYTVYGDAQQKVKEETFIVRWRLEPKDEDIEKFKRGELVEPKKPIVYYIDPATPKKWRKYLIQGVNDWQPAFEKAGFKNAIVAKEIQPGDSISLEDARYSVIRYFASNIENAYGPNVHDPRSGEILESHIGWYHNVMKLVHNWYMLQAGAIDPRARKMELDDDLMGQLIRFVSSHEVGHTIGLRHNWGSSSKTPVEKLRDKNWVEKNGHTASIMDYARFNYVAQPEDNITEKGIFPRIGDYDMWAIEWGYKPTFTNNPTDDQKIVNRWIIDRIGKNPRLWFGTERHPTDPRSQNEDLGDNAMVASDYGIKNLKRILPQLPEWTKEEADKYDNLETMYNQLITQFGRYMGHVAKNIGGIEETPKSIEEQGSVYAPTDRNTQKQAVAFLHKQLFETPEWLYNRDVINKTLNATGTDRIMNLQTATLKNLLSATTLNRLSTSTARFAPVKTYTVDELLNDMNSGIFSELKTKKATDLNRRNLQREFVLALSNLMSSTTTAGAPAARTETANADVSALAKAHLKMLRLQLVNALPATTDKISKYHFEDLADIIKKSLDPK